MNNRFFKSRELEKLFDANTLTADIASQEVVGVSEPCDFSLLIEERKIQGVIEQVLKSNFNNVDMRIKNGDIWLLDLNAQGMSQLLLDEDFVNGYCDKRGNPYSLSSRMTLYYDSVYSYWTEDVYLEAFEL